MIPNDRIVKITNRDSGTASYIVPDLNNLRRFFQRGETKEVSFDEIRKLANTSGGRLLLEDCFLIHDKEVVKEILGQVEPEYNYTEKDVEKLLLTGTLDQLLDCLEFAPQGVIELVKNKAVDLKINDLEKREAIKKKTLFDVTKAIMVNEITSEKEEEIKKTRRTTPVLEKPEGKKPIRRSTKYEIID